MFVTDKLFQPGIMFVGRLEPTVMEKKGFITLAPAGDCTMKHFTAVIVAVT